MFTQSYCKVHIFSFRNMKKKKKKIIQQKWNKERMFPCFECYPMRTKLLPETNLFRKYSYLEHH